MAQLDDKEILARLIKARAAVKKSPMPAPIKADLDKKIDALQKLLAVKVAAHDKVAKDITEFKAKKKSATAGLADFKAKILPPVFKQSGVVLDVVQTQRGAVKDPVVSELFILMQNLYAKGLNTELTLED